jgi:hypothetical protein
MPRTIAGSFCSRRRASVAFVLRSSLLDVDLADAVAFDVLPHPFVRSSRRAASQGLSDANVRTRKATGELLDQLLRAHCGRSENLPSGQGLERLDRKRAIGR